MAALLDSLISGFINEATTAPRLFEDLAKVEQYIAESYKTRAFIELIQNADDARATTVGIHDVPGGIAVGNNGRPFTIADVESLCRSGASHKRRGGDTIGYRGIGFKSAVNLAKSICVYSGDYAFYFDKPATRSLVNATNDVPLIRIPHQLKHVSGVTHAADVARLRSTCNYTTLFIFQGLDERISSEELIAFDRGCLLFLHNIKSVTFAVQNITRAITLESTLLNPSRRHVSIAEQGSVDNWEVLVSPLDTTNMIAFRLSKDEIIPAQRLESVFHSFTPTTDFTGAFIKINGDYSTDPSRQHIDMDERSRNALADAVALLADTIIDLLSGATVRDGFFSALIDSKRLAADILRPSIFPMLATQLFNLSVSYPDGGSAPFYTLKLRPDWLPYDDYEIFCKGKCAFIRRSLLGDYPEIVAFLEQLNVPTLSLFDVIEHVNQCALSPTGYAQVFTRLLKQFRYDLTLERIGHLRTLAIFPTATGVATAERVKATSALNQLFLQFIVANNDPADMKLFLSKIGIMLDSPVSLPEPIRQLAAAGPSGDSDHHPTPVSAGFKFQPRLKRWRNAEQNAAEYIRAIEGVSTVTDMSKANLGYDLEVVLESTRRLYVDVKSVSSFVEPFRLTNNEYTSAHEHGNDYALAVVVNSVPFQLMLIFNPVAKVALHKQCERWCWFCDDYQSELASASRITEQAGS